MNNTEQVEAINNELIENLTAQCRSYKGLIELHNSKIKQLESANQWISVDDALPEAGIEVVVIDECGTFTAAYLNSFNVWRLACDGITVEAGWDGGCAELDMIPTHWQPIEPPKESDNG